MPNIYKRKPNIEKRKQLKNYYKKLKLHEETSSEDYQNIIFKIGKEIFPDDLRKWFISLYQILFGSDSGQD